MKRNASLGSAEHRLSIVLMAVARLESRLIRGPSNARRMSWLNESALESNG